jgi:hypothetical protein
MRNISLSLSHPISLSLCEDNNKKKFILNKKRNFKAKIPDNW